MNIEHFKEGLAEISIVDLLVCLVGLFLLACWLLRTSFGRMALAGSVPRRNNMRVYIPLIPYAVCSVTVWLGLLVKSKLLGELGGWQSIFTDNLILTVGVLPAMAVIIGIARVSFVRRLKGFGLDARTLRADLAVALVNLLTIMPIVMAMILLTTYVNTWIVGPGFEMPQHAELKEIASCPQLPVRVMILVSAVLVIPVFEEMFFRGIIQTLIRSFLRRPWTSIVMTSAIFAAFHQDVPHWPALFALALCLGYSYEKSGSLLRPIFIHSLFNAVMVIGTLSQ